MEKIKCLIIIWWYNINNKLTCPVCKSTLTAKYVGENWYQAICSDCEEYRVTEVIWLIGE